MDNRGQVALAIVVSGITLEAENFADGASLLLLAGSFLLNQVRFLDLLLCGLDLLDREMSFELTLEKVKFGLGIAQIVNL